ncbi:lamina-associated polypeptide 2-like [Cololabis saira]|uniref:lamina-associated polypeptide 2-like n=1 Tax=Cololabis saira TaxID=129043 RepID=UPI002AD1DE35|nr:lamina-associated polypeptide 2-like [Cololabis saira]
MPEYLDDPSVLTKDKLKSELLAHHVELPAGNPTKDVFVQLYLKNLTALNKHKPALTAVALDAFSSDEELPPPPVVAAGRSRSSGRKSTRKTEKVQPDPDVTAFTDEALREELLKQGVDVGPIVASTRGLYEKKLQRLLDSGPAAPPPADGPANHNGSAEPDVYSDKEDEVTSVPEPEPVTVPEPEPEPVPVVDRPLRSRAKTPVTTRTRSSQHQKVEKITASEPTPKPEEKDVLQELFPNDVTSPTGFTITCRRPIRGAAGRPVIYSDLWSAENGLLFPKTPESSSYSSTESRAVHRVSSQPAPPALAASPISPSSLASSLATARPLAAAPPAGQSRAARRGLSVWIKLCLLCVVAVFLFLVYQAMETNSIGPFAAQEPEAAAAGGATA